MKPPTLVHFYGNCSFCMLTMLLNHINTCLNSHSFQLLIARAAMDAKNILGLLIVNPLKMSHFFRNKPQLIDCNRLQRLVEQRLMSRWRQDFNSLWKGLKMFHCNPAIDHLSVLPLPLLRRHWNTHTHAHSQIQISHMPGSRAIIQTAN